MTRGRGITMAVLSAVCYGASLPLSRLSYDYGSNPLTILTLRFLAIALIMGLWLRITGTSFAVSSRGLLARASFCSDCMLSDS